VATAESCTGGLLAFVLTRLPGSSDVYLGGVSAYANGVKVGLLGVGPDVLAAHGAVSGPVAEAMAAGVRAQTAATHAVAITGVAGPGGGTAQKPVGTVFVGVAGPGGTRSSHLMLSGDRDSIREAAARPARTLLRDALKSEGNPRNSGPCSSPSPPSRLTAKSSPSTSCAPSKAR
jgi:PncC family amidohydrolase